MHLMELADRIYRNKTQSSSRKKRLKEKVLEQLLNSRFPFKKTIKVRSPFKKGEFKSKLVKQDKSVNLENYKNPQKSSDFRMVNRQVIPKQKSRPKFKILPKVDKSDLTLKQHNMKVRGYKVGMNCTRPKSMHIGIKVPPKTIKKKMFCTKSSKNPSRLLSSPRIFSAISLIKPLNKARVLHDADKENKEDPKKVNFTKLPPRKKAPR